MIIDGMHVRSHRRDVDHVALLYTRGGLGVDITIKSYDEPTIETFTSHADEAKEHLNRYESNPAGTQAIHP